MSLLTRYWFRFDPARGVDRIYSNLGCGVTAFHMEDAKNLMADKIFAPDDLPPIAEMIENVDVSSLDAGHVLPNMMPPSVRGIWFPIGYP
ncbi:MAG: hypothetical protein AAGK14_08430 [Verrucomicrobiota bacterium]